MKLNLSSKGYFYYFVKVFFIGILFGILNLNAQDVKVDGYMFNTISGEIFDDKEDYRNQIKGLNKNNINDFVRTLLVKYYGLSRLNSMQEGYSFSSKVMSGQLYYTFDDSFNFYVYEWQKPIFKDQKGEINVYFFNFLSGPYSFVKDEMNGSRLIPAYEKTSKLNPPQFNFNKMIGEKFRASIDNSLAYMLVYDLDNGKTKVEYIRDENLNPLYNLNTDEAETPEFLYQNFPVYQTTNRDIWVKVSIPKKQYGQSSVEYLNVLKLYLEEIKKSNTTRGEGAGMEYLSNLEDRKFIGNRKKLLNTRGYPIFNKAFTRLKVVSTNDPEFNYAIYSDSDNFSNPKYGVLKFNLKKILNNSVVLVDNIYDSISYESGLFTGYYQKKITVFDNNGNKINKR